MFFISKMIVRFGQVFLWLYCRLLIRYRLKVTIQKTAIESAPAPRIIISNHVSHYDPFILIGSLSWKEMRIISPIRPMLAKGYFYSPLLPLAYLIGCYPTKPLISIMKRYAGTAAAIRYGNKGCTLGIYPEGRRVFNGDMVEPRYGVIKILQGLENPDVYLCRITKDPADSKKYFMRIVRDDIVSQMTDPKLIMDRIFNLTHNRII